jgi:predicted acetyltransferase
MMQHNRTELRELTEHDGMELFDMVREIGPGANGFVNGMYVDRFDQFQEKLKRNAHFARGLDIEPQYVQQTVYWFYVNEAPVGYGKLRHRLNEQLRLHGGHIGYVIRPSARGNGYASLFLRELLRQAGMLGIDEVLLTCEEGNWASRRAIERNEGMLIEQEGNCCRYTIRTGGNTS